MLILMVVESVIIFIINASIIRLILAISEMAVYFVSDWSE